MKNYTLGIALSITTLTIIAFVYCAFIGLCYGLNGNIIIAGILSLIGFAAIAISLYVMINSKIKRNAREGRPKELFSALIILFTLLAGSIPYMKFIEIYDQKDEMFNLVRETIDSAQELDSTYIQYCENRINTLPNTKYRNSLRRRLIPKTFEETSNERNSWLANLSDASFWNIYTATNVHALSFAVEKWVNEYKTKSQIKYNGEECEDFEYEVATSKINQFKSIFSEFHFPSVKGVLFSLVCFVLILLCYKVTIRPKTGVV